MKYIIIVLLSAIAQFSSFDLVAAHTFYGFQSKQTKTQASTKPADARTKTGDKIDHSMKGPKGETVYSGPKGGKYYLGKNDVKIYLKKE